MRSDSHLTGPISGHVYLKHGKRGASWYYRARLPHEVRKRLGPAWTGKGRPPAGQFTRKTAEAKLQEILADARRGTLAGAVKTGVKFADAAAEWLRYVDQDRKRKHSTIADYNGVLEHALNPEMLLCLSSRHWGSVFEEAVEAAGEVALEAAGCFAPCLAFLQPSFDVSDRGGV